jgi:hypothetical protein
VEIRLMAARDRGNELSLRAWAAEAESAAFIAKSIAHTDFVPEQLRRYTNPQERDPSKRILDYEATVQTVAAVLLAGQELGLQPMASLRTFTIIRGTVAMYALAARALLLQHGHDVVVVESTDTRAIVRGRRAGTDTWQQAEWNLDRAKIAGLFPGPERGNWRTQTKAMLVARATAEASRWVAADALLGLPPLVEELDDDGQAPLAIESTATATAIEGDGQAAAGTRQRKAPVRRAALPSAPPPPDTPGPPIPAQRTPEVPEEPRPAGPKPTAAQLSKLHAGLRDIGITDAEGGLALVSGWAGRTVARTSDLTRAEMGVVLTRLDALIEFRAQAEHEGEVAAQDAEEHPPPPPEGNGDPP